MLRTGQRIPNFPHDGPEEYYASVQFEQWQAQLFLRAAFRNLLKFAATRRIYWGFALLQS
jgi:hypothetical protein